MRRRIGRVTRGAVVAVAALGVISGSLATATAAQAQPSSSVVVSEVYGGGGNSGSTYTNDFVELTNRGTTAVDLTGFSVQYHSKSATGTWQTTPLTAESPGTLPWRAVVHNLCLCTNPRMQPRPPARRHTRSSDPIRCCGATSATGAG